MVLNYILAGCPWCIDYSQTPLMDTERAIESVLINRVSVSGGFREKIKGFLFPGTKQTVRKNEVFEFKEVSVRRLTVLRWPNSGMRASLAR